MERFAEVVLRHRVAVTLLWVVLLVGGFVAAGQLSDRLSFDFSLPGQPGYETERQLLATYGVSSDDTLVPVLTVPEGQTVAGRRADVAAVFDTVRKQLPRLRVVDLASTGDATFVFGGGRRTFALVQGEPSTGFGPGTAVALAPVLRQAAAARGLQTGLTSYALLSAGGDSSGPSVLVETLLGALGGLLVLVFVFASFLAFVPLVIAAVSILTTFLLVLGLTELTAVSVIVQFLISLVGLGVAIDYSLLLVSRWREERAHGHDNHTAVVTAMRTAGHAVLAYGVTVAISLLALLVVPVPFLRSMGLGGLLIPLVSVAAVLTLLPALLSSIGPRIDWPRIRREGTASRGWSAWARAIVLLIIAVITFVLLARTFRSVLLPVKAVLLNLVSMAAVFGSVVFFWQQGNGSHAVFGVAPTGAITCWLPVIIFAFLFGLSMDYEVFILARMREEYDATGSTSAAVAGGLGRTGRLVTSAALILFFSFAALASAPGTDVKVLGTALGAGILIDATVIRTLLVPALVSLLGRWNWWLPTRLATLLRVAPSPLGPLDGDRDEPSTAHDPQPRIGRHARGPLVVNPFTLVDTLDVASGISGAVRRADASPLVGIPVTLIGTGGRQVAVVRTDQQGAYQLQVSTGGAYLLVATAIGYQPAAFLVTVVRRPVRQEIVLLDLDVADSRLPRGAHASAVGSRD